MGKKLQFILWVVVILLVLVLLGETVYSFVRSKTESTVHPEVTFDFGEQYGKVVMELYPEYAPNTVCNIINLVNKGYYNNKVLYGKDEVCLYLGRDTEGNAVDPKASLVDESIEPDSEADYKYSIAGEFVANNFFDNTLRNEKGIVTLIRNDYSQIGAGLATQSYNSGNAQIGIIMGKNASVLNGLYAPFGKILEGQDVLDKIYSEAEIAKETTTNEETGEVTETEPQEGAIQAFANKPVISSATVDTKGVEFEKPVIQEMFDYSSYLYQMYSAQ